MNFGLLSLLIWLPIAAGVVVLLMGSERIAAARWVALIASIVTFVASLPLLSGYDHTTAAFQFLEKLPWIPAFQAYYGLGVDGIALPLIILDDAHHHPGDRGGVDGDRAASGAVLRRLPDHGRPDGRRVQRDRCAAVLLLLGSHADPDVPHHRYLGRPAARLRDASSSSCTRSSAPSSCWWR